MMKKLLALALAFAMLLAFTACGDGQSTTEPTESTTSHIREIKTKVAAVDDPTGYAFVKLQNDRSYAYDVQFYGDAQEIIPLLKSGEIDVAAIPVDAAAKLFNESNGLIQVLAVNSLSMLHVVETGTSIKSVADLEGKTVYATGEGTVAEYVINHILEKNGIDPEKDVDIQFKADPEELAALAVKGEAEICILPEPYVSDIIVETNPMEDTTDTTAQTAAAEGSVKIRKALDITDEWDKISETPLAQGVVVARTDYISANPEIISEFIGFNEVSVNYLTVVAETGAIFLVDKGYFDDPTVAMGSVANSNTMFIEGAEMKAAVSAVLEVFLEADAASIGGAMPADSFYYGA